MWRDVVEAGKVVGVLVNEATVATVTSLVFLEQCGHDPWPLGRKVISQREYVGGS